MLFLGIISWEGASSFNGGFVFQMGGGFILSGGVPHGRALVLMGGGVRKKSLDGGGGNPHAPSTMGNPGKY